MLLVFLSTNDSIVAELTLAFPTMLIFLISANETFVNIIKKIIIEFINSLYSYCSYTL